MLILHRIVNFNEFLKCKASGKILMYGDFYYTDTDDPSVLIDAQYYYNKKMEEKKENWEFDSIRTTHEDLRDYEKELKETEQEYLTSTMLTNYDLFGHDAYNYQRQEDNP